jgi:hypothetical protein
MAPWDYTIRNSAERTVLVLADVRDGGDFFIVLKIATRSPERQTIRARFSGMSATAQESTNSSSVGDGVTRL